MQYNDCKTCGAKDGRAGVLINDECLGCRDTQGATTPTPRESWTVGRLHDPQPEEKLSPFDSLSSAEAKALRRAACDDKDVIAVWDHDDNVVAVYTAGLILEPVR